MQPNPDQLQFIDSKATAANPASYEPATELTPPKPVVIIGPNAVYLNVPGHWDQKLGEAQPPTEPPAEVEAPVLSMIEPNSLPVTQPDTTVLFRGNFFTPDSVIMWNGSPEPTTFIDSQNLSTIVRTSTVQAPLPFTLQALIVTGDKESEPHDFTFTA